MSEHSTAAVFDPATGSFSMSEFPIPLLQDGQVLVRVLCCTLCGSDLHTIGGKRSAPGRLVLGHEVVGRIVSVQRTTGSDAESQFEVGDRITWSIMASCGVCFYCQNGIRQKCEHLYKYGHQSVESGGGLGGGLSEYCLLEPGTTMALIPDSIPDAVGASCNCATATVAAACRRIADLSGTTVLVQGLGLLGLTACAMLKQHGVSTVLATDTNQGRLDIASQYGADKVFSAEDTPRLLTGIHDQTNGRGVDAVLEFSGSVEACEMSIDAARIGGHIVFVGSVFPTRPMALLPESVVRKMLRIEGVHNYAPDDLLTAVRFLESNHQRFPFEKLVAATYPLGQIERAVEHATRGDAIRIAVQP